MQQEPHFGQHFRLLVKGEEVLVWPWHGTDGLVEHYWLDGSQEYEGHIHGRTGFWKWCFPDVEESIAFPGICPRLQNQEVAFGIMWQ